MERGGWKEAECECEVVGWEVKREVINRQGKQDKRRCLLPLTILLMHTQLVEGTTRCTSLLCCASDTKSYPAHGKLGASKQNKQ